MAKIKQLFVPRYEDFRSGRDRRGQDGQIIFALEFNSWDPGRFCQNSILSEKLDKIIDRVLSDTELKFQNASKFA